MLYYIVGICCFYAYLTNIYIMQIKDQVLILNGKYIIIIIVLILCSYILLICIIHESSNFKYFILSLLSEF